MYGFELKNANKDRFSSLICNELQQDEWNTSKPGASNDRIWRTTMSDLTLVKQKPKAVVIMWSGINRSEFVVHVRNKWLWKNGTWKSYKLDKNTMCASKDSHMSGNIDVNDTRYNIMNNYMKSKPSIHSLRYTIASMLSIKALCKSLNIPLLNYTFSRTQYVDNLDTLDWLMYDSTNGDEPTPDISKREVLQELPFIEEPGFYDYCKLNNLPIGKKDHPLEGAHIWMANKIIKDLKKHGIHRKTN